MLSHGNPVRGWSPTCLLISDSAQRRRSMLVLSRKDTERIFISGAIVVTVVKIQGGVVRLGIEAPPEIVIASEELLRSRNDARDKGQGAVLPGGLTSLGAWDDVVDGQFRRPRPAAAILAGGMVALEEVATAERDRIVTRPIVPGQGQNLGDAQAEPDRADEQLSILWRQLCPVGPRVELEIVGIDHVGGVVPEQYQRSRHRGHMNGLPVAVQHQSRSLQNAHSHDVRTPRPIWCLPGVGTSAG